MKFKEAEEQGYTIIVASTHVAKKLRKKYKKNIFKSIRSRTMDALRNIFIDETLRSRFKNETKYLEKNRVAYDVIYGSVPSADE